MTNWFDLVPYPVAQEQTTWERRRQVRRAVAAAGLDWDAASLQQIGEILGGDANTARKLHLGWISDEPPIARWFAKLDRDISILRSNHPPKAAEQVQIAADGFFAADRWYYPR